MIKAIGLVLVAIVGLWLLTKGKVVAEAPPEISEETPPPKIVTPEVERANALAQAILSGSLPADWTASLGELSVLDEGGFSKGSGAYEAAIDLAYEEAAREAKATGGVVSWTSAGGYEAISPAEATEMFYGGPYGPF